MKHYWVRTVIILGWVMAGCSSGVEELKDLDLVSRQELSRMELEAAKRPQQQKPPAATPAEQAADTASGV